MSPELAEKTPNTSNASEHRHSNLHMAVDEDHDLFSSNQKPLSSHAGNGGTLQCNQRSADLLFLSFTLSKILHVDGHCTTTELHGQKN